MESVFQDKGLVCRERGPFAGVLSNSGCRFDPLRACPEAAEGVTLGSEVTTFEKPCLAGNCGCQETSYRLELNS